MSVKRRVYHAYRSAEGKQVLTLRQVGVGGGEGTQIDLIKYIFQRGRIKF